MCRPSFRRRTLPASFGRWGAEVMENRAPLGFRWRDENFAVGVARSSPRRGRVGIMQQWRRSTFRASSLDGEWHRVKVTVSHAAGTLDAGRSSTPRRNVLSEEVALTEADDARDYYFEYRDTGWQFAVASKRRRGPPFIGRNSCNRNPCHAASPRVRGTLNILDAMAPIRSSRSMRSLTS